MSITPEDMGNPSVQAWGLITQLEDKVREKNLIIEQHKDELKDLEIDAEFWKYKYYGVEVLVGKWSHVMWGLVGGVVGGGLTWLLKH